MHLENENTPLTRSASYVILIQTFAHASLEELRQWVHQYHLLVVGASPDGAVPYDQVRYTRPNVLVLGEERAGLSQDQRALCREIARIPMVAGADSLNLGVAGSLLMYAVVGATKRP